jgi:hypothetical protein
MGERRGCKHRGVQAEKQRRVKGKGSKATNKAPPFSLNRSIKGIGKAK